MFSVDSQQKMKSLNSLETITNDLKLEHAQCGKLKAPVRDDWYSMTVTMS